MYLSAVENDLHDCYVEHILFDLTYVGVRMDAPRFFLLLNHLE